MFLRYLLLSNVFCTYFFRSINPNQHAQLGIIFSIYFEIEVLYVMLESV